MNFKPKMKLLLCSHHYIFAYCETQYLPAPIAQSVKCLATDASLTTDTVVTSLIMTWSNTFVEIDHEIISTIFVLPSAK